MVSRANLNGDFCTVLLAEIDALGRRCCFSDGRKHHLLSSATSPLCRSLSSSFPSRLLRPTSARQPGLFSGFLGRSHSVQPVPSDTPYQPAGNLWQPSPDNILITVEAFKEAAIKFRPGITVICRRRATLTEITRPGRR